MIEGRYRTIARRGGGPALRVRVGLVAIVALTFAIASLGSCSGASGPGAASASQIRVDPAAIAVVGGERLIVVGLVAGDGAHGAIAVSEDGGTTWSERTLATPRLTGVAAAGSTIFATAACSVPLGPDCLWRSFDGGASFQDTPGVPALVHPGLLDGQRGYVMTPAPYGTTVWRTTDGGEDWMQTGDACVSGPTVAIDFPSPDVSWTACAGPGPTGQEGRSIWKSNWAGSSLQMMSSVGLGLDAGVLPSGGTLLGISMTADGHGWLWSDEGFYATSDGGATWGLKVSESGSAPEVVAARMTGAQTGFAILVQGGSGWIGRTTDGGSTWIRLDGFGRGTADRRTA